MAVLKKLGICDQLEMNENLTILVCCSQLLTEWHTFAFRQALHKSERLTGNDDRVNDANMITNRAHIFACNGLDDIIRRCAEEFSDNRELIDIFVYSPLSKEGNRTE